MRRFSVYSLGLVALWLACDAEVRPPAPADETLQSSAGVKSEVAPARRGDDAGAEARRHVGDTGTPRDEAETSVPGRSAHQDQGSATSSCDAAQCERRARELAQSLKAAASPAVSVKGGDCARVDIGGSIAGMACTCQSSNGWLYIGPAGAGCFVRGRAGDCLWDDSEFDSCIAGEPVCAAICDELNRRYAADAANLFDVELRYSGCEDEACHHVLRIDDACYADYSFENGRDYACTLSNAEILTREASAPR